MVNVQDASVHVASLDPQREVVHELGEGRGAYAYLIDGAASDDQDVSTGDAAKVVDQPRLRIRARERSELILVDVPMRFEPVGIWPGARSRCGPTVGLHLPGGRTGPMRSR